MNIHEECLLKFLQKPDELSHSTDVLKVNNHIFEQSFINKVFLAKSLCISYTDNK